MTWKIKRKNMRSDAENEKKKFMCTTSACNTQQRWRFDIESG
jgi:hypothetical protein